MLPEKMYLLLHFRIGDQDVTKAIFKTGCYVSINPLQKKHM